MEQTNTNSTPAAIRIRDNQRRSRARHKEYVENLQHKVQEYERRGVEATLEMQRAARDVAIENDRLKTLLAKKGVPGDEVEAYLRSFGDSAGNTAALAAIARMVNNAGAAELAAGGASSTTTPVTPGGFDTSSNASSSMTATPTPGSAALPATTTTKVLLEPAPPAKGRVLAAAPAGPLSPTSGPRSEPAIAPRPAAGGPPPRAMRREPLTKGGASPMSLNNLMNGDELPPIRPRPAMSDSRMDTTDDCCDGLTQCSGLSGRIERLPPLSSIESLEHHHRYGEGSSSGPQGRQGGRSVVNGNSSPSEASMEMSPHEMSCKTAAQIIAGMHGNVDREVARTALGCDSKTDCTVKNTKLFRILEDHSRFGPT